MPPFELVIMMVALFAIFYFLLVRPQKKRFQQDQEMRAALQEGDRVILTSGMFGTISYVGERQLFIELAPGVEVTVLKGAVTKKATPEDEEFVVTDDVADDDLAADEVGEPTDADLSADFDNLRPEDFQDPKAGDK